MVGCNSAYKFRLLMAFLCFWLTASASWVYFEKRIFKWHIKWQINNIISDAEVYQVLLAGGSNAKFGYSAQAWGVNAKNVSIYPANGGSDSLYLSLLNKITRRHDLVVIGLLSPVVEIPMYYKSIGFQAYAETIGVNGEVAPSPFNKFSPLGFQNGESIVGNIATIALDVLNNQPQGDFGGYQCGIRNLTSQTEKLANAPICITCIERMLPGLQALKDKGVVVLLQLPWIYTDKLHQVQWLDKFNKISSIYKTAGFQVIRTDIPEVHIDSKKFFCDGFHLNSEGAKVRTNNLKAYLAKHMAG